MKSIRFQIADCISRYRLDRSKDEALKKLIWQVYEKDYTFGLRKPLRFEKKLELDVFLHFVDLLQQKEYLRVFERNGKGKCCDICLTIGRIIQRNRNRFSACSNDTVNSVFRYPGFPPPKIPVRVPEATVSQFLNLVERIRRMKFLIVERTSPTEEMRRREEEERNRKEFVLKNEAREREMKEEEERLKILESVKEKRKEFLSYNRQRLDSLELKIIRNLDHVTIKEDENVEIYENTFEKKIVKEPNLTNSLSPDSPTPAGAILPIRRHKSMGDMAKLLVRMNVNNESGRKSPVGGTVRSRILEKVRIRMQGRTNRSLKNFPKSEEKDL